MTAEPTHTLTACAISNCRICGNSELVTVLDLGEQALTGVFPREADAPITRGPMRLVKCAGREGCCGLVQLAHTYNPREMYGDNYGYRSGLNRSMVKHLSDKVAWLLERRPVSAGDLVLDIGSNDGTTLGCYPKDLELIGIDPTSDKFRQHLPSHVTAVADFFSAASFHRISGGRKARIITSLAMFYDLPAPTEFARDIASALADDGVWHFEQSYLPLMLETNGYDTVCHEHVEYYALKQIQWITSRVGLRITDVQLNEVNGGSFAVTVEKGVGDAPIVAELLQKESALESLEQWQQFGLKVAQHREALCALLKQLKAEGKKVFGLGASTKGNVLLQYCGIGPDLLECVAEVNPDKFGTFTPGTRIPICSERQALAAKPDYWLVLPWHFRKSFIEREAEFTAHGAKLLFPLPWVERWPS